MTNNYVAIHSQTKQVLAFGSFSEVIRLDECFVTHASSRKFFGGWFAKGFWKNK